MVPIKMFPVNFLPVVLILFVSACSNPAANIKKDFDASSGEYNKLYSAQRFQEASYFVSGELFEAYAEKAEAANRIKIIDFIIIRVDYDEQGKKAEVRAEITYYGLSKLSVRKITDTQKWVYTIENGAVKWRLTSILPDFP